MREETRAYCDSGWAGACAGKVQATGTGDWAFGAGREATEEGDPLPLGTGNGDPPGPRQKMWIGNGSSRPLPFRPSQALRPSPRALSRASVLRPARLRQALTRPLLSTPYPPGPF